MKKLSLLDATLLVSGSMIGSGIFIVSTFMARDLGSAGWMMALWLITGVITIIAALSYGELAGMMPTAGGQYVYIQRAYNKLTAFLYGWTVFTVIQTGVIAAVAVAFANYAGEFFPFLINPVFNAITIGTFEFTVHYSQLLAIALIVFLTYINTQGINNGKIIQLVFTSAKLIALFGLIFVGLIYGLKGNTLWENFSNAWQASTTSSIMVDGTITKEWIPLSGWGLAIALGASIINPLFSSDAWNNVTFIAAEIENPKRNIPLSLFWGTFIVTIIYCLANIAYLALLPMSEIQNAAENRVGTAAVSVIFGSVAKYLMAALIMVSTFGCNNGIILAGGRLFQTMAKDGLFFTKAAEINKNGVPAYALWVQCAWASILCLSGKYGALLTYATFASLLFYMLTIGGLFILRKNEPDAERPYKAFGYPYVPMLYILITAFICFALLYNDTSRGETLIGLFIVALGFPVYYLWKDVEKRRALK